MTQSPSDDLQKTIPADFSKKDASKSAFPQLNNNSESSSHGSSSGVHTQPLSSSSKSSAKPFGTSSGSSSLGTASFGTSTAGHANNKGNSNPPPPPRKTHGVFVFIAVALAAIVATLAGMSGYSKICSYARWFGCLACVYYAMRRSNLTTWIFVSMIIGVEVGYSFPDFAVSLRSLSDIFLRLIKTIIAPLLFSTMVIGIAGHANIKEVGRMGLKALIYFEIVTCLALLLGLIAINITQAGVGMMHTDTTKLQDIAVDVQASSVSEALIKASKGLSEAASVKGIANAKELKEASEGLNLAADQILHINKVVVQPKTGMEIVVHAFPENFGKSVVENDVLQVVVFSVLFAIALAQIPEEKRKPMLNFCESLADIMFKYTNIVMLLAPIGVGAAIAYTVGGMGLNVLGNLAKLVGTLYLSLIVFILIVLVPAMLICRLDIKRFFKTVLEPVTLAFATTSSEAALPKAMERMEQFGVPRHIVAFVMPTGYSFNLDGTTLYLSLAAVFVAQAANIELSISDQMLIVFTLMLTSKGVAGMPRASMVVLLGAAASFGLPEWPILAIMGVDALMDMARTATNVFGNCLASAVVAKWENQLGPAMQEQNTIAIARLVWDSDTNTVKSLDKK